MRVHGCVYWRPNSNKFIRSDISPADLRAMKLEGKPVVYGHRRSEHTRLGRVTKDATDDRGSKYVEVEIDEDNPVNKALWIPRIRAGHLNSFSLEHHLVTLEPHNVSIVMKPYRFGTGIYVGELTEYNIARIDRENLAAMEDATPTDAPMDTSPSAIEAMKHVIEGMENEETRQKLLKGVDALLTGAEKKQAELEKKRLETEKKREETEKELNATRQKLDVHSEVTKQIATGIMDSYRDTLMAQGPRGEAAYNKLEASMTNDPTLAPALDSLVVACSGSLGVLGSRKRPADEDDQGGSPRGAKSACGPYDTHSGRTAEPRELFGDLLSFRSQHPPALSAAELSSRCNALMG